MSAVRGRKAPLLALIASLACTGEPPRDGAVRAGPAIIVRHDTTLKETSYEIASGDCRITWTTFASELNRGVVRHRSGCGLAPDSQAALIRSLVRRLVDSGGGAAAIRTLTWGRLSPDGARDFTMAERLALAAKRSPGWDAVRGEPRDGDVNGWVRALANESAIYAELRSAFNREGLDLTLSSVEKVLVLPAGQLSYFETLRAAGVLATDRVPFDCQAWFSVRPLPPPPP